MAKTIYVLNVPNLDLLGICEPEANGHATWSDVEKLCVETAQRYGLCTDCRHCSREDELIEFIHEAHAKNAVGIVVNAGSYFHTSVALHDALVAARIPAIEVHVSNVGAGDNFRHHSFTAQAAFASLCGFGIDGFRLAISGLAAKIGVQAAA
jgi:3-dehydroquinate dehydratase-2